MCTRVFWNDNGDLMIVGRSMDWPETTEPILTVFPRGTRHDGGLLGGHRVVENGLEWEAKYGSLVVTVYGLGAADGLNERGLAAHMLYLDVSELPPVDPAKPALQCALWAQYLLDNAATVKEALELQNELQLAMVEARGFKATVHLALDDASGDSAIIEYVDGKTVVHHGARYQVMTNAPAYDTQLALLAQQDFSNPSSDTPLPGNVSAVDRFQRAAYYLEMLPDTDNERQAVANVLAIMRNVSVPFGAPYKTMGVYNTEYRTIADLNRKVYFFELSTLPNVIWTDLDKFDLSPGSGVRLLDPNNLELSGDVTNRFVSVAAPY